MNGRNVRFWPKADIGYCTAHVRFRGAGIRFRGRYWGQSGHALLHCICPLMTQSGHWPRAYPFLHARES
jgi:hypothetical protein